MSEHCSHCPGPEDPRHADPAFAQAEADCAYYEDPANLVATGPARRHPKDMTRRHCSRQECYIVDASVSRRRDCGGIHSSPA